jgi:hypothetical protein
MPVGFAVSRNRVSWLTGGERAGHQNYVSLWVHLCQRLVSPVSNFHSHVFPNPGLGKAASLGAPGVDPIFWKVTPTLNSPLSARPPFELRDLELAGSARTSNALYIYASHRCSQSYFPGTHIGRWRPARHNLTETDTNGRLDTRSYDASRTCKWVRMTVRRCGNGHVFLNGFSFTDPRRTTRTTQTAATAASTNAAYV